MKLEELPQRKSIMQMTRKELMNVTEYVHLKMDVVLRPSARRYAESARWKSVMAEVVEGYPKTPDVFAGYYVLVEAGNGGRELAVRSDEGIEFLVHQDHASII